MGNLCSTKRQPSLLTELGRFISHVEVCKVIAEYVCDFEGVLAKTLQGTGRILALASLGDDKIASSALDNSICIWDVRIGAPIMKIVAHNKPVAELVVLGNGKLVSGSRDGLVCVWDVANTTRCLKLERFVNIHALAAIGDRFMTSAWSHLVQIWDATTGECLNSFPHTHRTQAIVAISESQFASGSDDHHVRIFNAHEAGAAQLVRVLKGHTNAICSLIAIEQGTQLVSGSVDTTVRIWEVGGNCLRVLKTFKIAHNITEFGFHKLAFSCSWFNDFTLRTWDLNNSKHTVYQTQCTYSLIAFGNGLAAGFADGTICIWK